MTSELLGLWLLDVPRKSGQHFRSVSRSKCHQLNSYASAYESTLALTASRPADQFDLDLNNQFVHSFSPALISGVIYHRTPRDKKYVR